MAYEVVWSIAATLDLTSIIDFISHDSFESAVFVENKICSAVDSLSDFPNRHRVVAELGHKDIRELFVLNFRIIYRVCGDSVVIMAVIHTARDFKGWQSLQDVYFSQN